MLAIGQRNLGSSDYFNAGYINARVPCNSLGFEPDKINMNKGYAGLLVF
jgi:hypothetical protein